MEKTRTGCTPATAREIRGWYAYNWAAEVVSVVGLSVFLPLVIEELTSRNGVQRGTQLACTDETLKSCVVPFGTGVATTVSYTMYVTSISVGLQALTFISLGSLADYGPWRKLFMQAFTLIGGLSFVLYAVVTPQLYQMAAVLMVIGNVAFGAANVFYNAYLPLLVQNHPSIEASRIVAFSDDSVGYHDASKMDAYLQTTSAISNEISAKGFAYGYTAGVLLLVVSALIVYFMGQTTFSMQLVLCLCGIWWLVWSFWTWRTLQVRPGPPLPMGESWLLFSWKRVGKTICQWRRIPNMFLFLAAFFLFSDGSNTITSLAILYAKTVLKLTKSELIIVAIIVPLVAGIGNLAWLRIEKRFGWSTKRTLLTVLSLLFVVPIYGTLSIWLPLMQTKAEVYAVAVWFGSVLGAWQSSSRVLVSDMIPPGHESEFFSLYEITNKGSSWLGPLVVGAITNISDDTRYSYIFLMVMLGLPLPLLAKVNVAKGKEEARRYASMEDDRLLPPSLESLRKDDEELAMHTL